MVAGCFGIGSRRCCSMFGSRDRNYSASQCAGAAPRFSTMLARCIALAAVAIISTIQVDSAAVVRLLHDPCRNRIACVKKGATGTS